MALLSDSDEGLIKIVRNRFENGRIDLAHLIDLLNDRIRESDNDELLKWKRKLEMLQTTYEQRKRCFED